MAGLLHNGFWQDLGTRANYARIHMEALDGKNPLHIPGTPLGDGVWAGKDVRLADSAVVRPPVFIGPGSTVGPRAAVGPYAVLGRSVVIEDDARVRRSILWDRVRIPGNRTIESKLVSRRFQCGLPARTGT